MTANEPAPLMLIAVAVPLLAVLAWVLVRFLGKIPFSAAMNKGLIVLAVQTRVYRHSLERASDLGGSIDPSFIITRRAKLEDGPSLYETARDASIGASKSC